jgi:hypothetical protein
MGYIGWIVFVWVISAGVAAKRREDGQPSSSF